MPAFRAALLPVVGSIIVLGATACARASHASADAPPPASAIVVVAVEASDKRIGEEPSIAVDRAPPAVPRRVEALIDRQGRPAVARAGEHEVLAAEDGPADAQGRFTRIRMLRRDGMKYPLIRQIEQMQLGPHGEVSRLAVHEVVADHVQVTVHDPATRAQLANALPAGFSVLRALPGTPVVLVSIPAAALGDHPAALAALTAMPGVGHADPDWLVQASITPDDTMFAEQWALDNQGQEGGTVDADIDAPEAWAYHTGSRTVKVGIIDTGLELGHPDLAANLWTNPGEIPGNSVDDDGNGYIDDVHGWNFAGDNANPDDDNFHGTHVAGTIGASAGNGIGVVGVCWQVTLVPLKFLDANGSGYTSDAVAAVYYASSIGCDLTSNSWGGGGFDQTLKDAIDAAGAQGRLFIAAAGNDGSDIGAYPSYPASYACSNIVTVAATDRNDVLAGFSNYNASAVHIAAPGVSILSTFPLQQTAAMASRGLGPTYGSISGTSMATPHVSGAIALLKAAEPGLDAAALRSRLLQRCDAIPGLVGKVAGARRLNLRQLLDPAWTTPPAALALTGTALSEQTGNGDGFPGPGETLRLVPGFMNVGGVDPGQCTITALAASAGVTVLPPTAGTVTGMPPLAPVTGPAFSVQLAGGLADGQSVAVDFAVFGPAGGLGTFRWSSVVAAPPPRAEVATAFAIGEMVADPNRNLVYVIDKTAPAILAINTQTGRLAARTMLVAGSFTWGQPAVSADGASLYVCHAAAGLIQCLSLPGLQTVRTITCQGWQPVSAATAADGSLYVSSGDYWGPIRKLDPVSGAVTATLRGHWGDYYQHALLRTNVAHNRLFVTETGLYTSGGPNYVDEFDISGSTPLAVKSHPYDQVYLGDFAIDEAGSRILTTCGGIYGIQVTDMVSGAYGTVWPFGYPYGRAVELLPGDGSAYGASGGPYGATICRFDLASGVKTADYPLSKGSTYSLSERGFALAPDRRMVYRLDQWRGDGGGYEGSNWKLGIIGCASLTLDNYPRAAGTVTPLSGVPGMTVTGNGTASYDPDAGGGIVSYQWNFGDGATAATAIASHSYPVRGSYTVTLDVTDVEGLVDRKSFSVLVNGAPVPQAQSVTTLEDTAKPIVMAATDPEGDVVTYSIVSYPGKGSLSGTVPNLTYTPYANQNGSDSFVFRASDGLSSANATVSIAITPVNDPPVASDRSVLTRIDSPVAVSIAALDPDSTVLSYAIVQVPASGVLSGTAPNLTYTPAAGFAGIDSLRFTASDGALTSATATVSIRVNRPPVAQPVSVAVVYDTPAAFVLSGSDADGQSLTYRVTTSPVRGTVSGTAPNLTYTPKAGETGSDSLLYVANDGYHDSVPATVTFTISATNPWEEADLALATGAGSTAFTPTGAGFAVRGYGDCGSSGDGGRFTWTTLPADGALIARVTAISGGRGGLMLRTATASDAACAALLLDAGQLRLVVRAGDGQAATSTALGAQAAPCWLRLQRTAGGVDAARSSDGRTWTQLGSAAVQLPATALAGLWAGSSAAGPAQLGADQVRTHHSLDRTWQTFGFSPSRTGEVPGVFAGTSFIQQWQATPGGDLNPVGIGNGLVFATKSIYMTTAWIKAFDLATGAERWNINTPSAYSVNPAAFAEGRVFVQRCNNYSDTQLWCISAATGTPLWKAPFGSQWERYMAGCPANGMLYIDGGSYGGMYGFDQVDGTQRFFNSALGQYDQWAPAFAGGQLFSWVAGIARGHDPASGAAAWTVDCGWTWNGYSMNTVPVVSGGSLVLRGNGALHVVDTASRTRRWTVNAAVAGTPAVTADAVYALVGTQLNAYALSDGSLRRSFTAGSALIDQPLVTDDSIIVASATSTWILDRSTFTVRQTLATGGHPALAGRTLVLSNSNGAICAFTAPVPNVAPVATGQAVPALEDTPVAITLAGNDPEGQPLTFQVATPPTHGSLSGTPPALSYQPQADYAGGDAFTFTVHDGVNTSATATVNIVVAGVNDRPSIVVGSDQVADNDGRPVSVSGFAQFNPGPADESSQHVSYAVTADRSDLFAVQPAVSADGTLSFTPAMDATGVAVITIVCQDDGGTANGGVDTALPATVRIEVRSRWDAELAAEAVNAVALVASDTQAAESGDSGHLVIIRSGPTTSDLVVNLACAGTAGNGVDFVRIPASITIPAGQALLDIAIVPVPDGLTEGNETATITLMGGADYLQLPGTLQSATVILVDDEPVTVNAAASDATMTEPADNGTFTVSRTGDPSTALTVQVSVSGTAVPGVDYAALPQSVTIPAGATSVAIPARVIDDSEAEERETVILTVLPGSGYVVGTAQATATIGDNEPEVVGIEPPSGPAAEPGITGAFRVYRRGVASAARTLTYTVGGTATAGSDYPALPGSVTLAANASSANIVVTPTNDNVVEVAETVDITLAAPSGAGLANATASLTILDNDGSVRPTVSLKTGIAAAREPAGDGSFVISRTGATTAPLRVLLQPGSGTATAGLDYTALPSQVVIPAGAASLILAVHPLDDQLAEAPETVGLALAASTDYSISTVRSGTVTLADDELPTVVLAVADGTAAEPGSDTGRWTVLRAGDLSQPLTVRLDSNGTATAGVDYAALPSSVTIPAGFTTAAIILAAHDDAEAETDEQVVLQVLPDPAYRLNGAAAGAITIKDDEAAVLELIAIDPAATEGGDTGKFRICRRGSLAAALSVPMAWSGTAQNGVDVNTMASSVVLAANAAVLDLIVTVRQDSVIEPAETLTGTLQPGAGYTLGQPAATIRIVDDEGGGTVAIRMPTPGGYEFDGIPAYIEIYRTGKANTAITVPYSVSGTATIHELTVPRQVVLPAGVDQVRLRLVPLRDERVESDETVVLDLLPGSGYLLGADVEGVFTIIEAPPGSG